MQKHDLKPVRVAVIGLGGRGYGMLKDIVLPQKGVWVTAVCDLYQDRVDAGVQAVLDAGQPAPFATTDYRAAVAAENVDAVMVFCAWEAHVPVTIAAMEAGRAVALEVGGAYELADCWRLVDTWERTRVPFFFLENCCFGKRETMVLNMVRKGLFGKIVHCKGGYHHDLRQEVAEGKKNRHYRLRNYLHRNCENYPTHELGPIAKVLDINRGNRMLTLCSVSGAAMGLAEYVKTHCQDDPALADATFAQGDVVNTIITCARGQTILLTLDTTLPRSYSRDFTVQGTKGMYSEESDSVFIDGVSQEYWECKPTWGTAEQFEEHLVPIWKKTLQDGTVGSHGGMDWLEMECFLDCLRNGKPMPLDVYDAAAWMAITPLSEASIAMGGAPVSVPDFTRGQWHMRPVLDVTELG